MSDARRIDAAQSAEAARRWRLVLGRYAERSLAADSVLGAGDAALEHTLGQLYDRAYGARGHRLRGAGGSLEESVVHGLTWLANARELFPRSTFERMQVQAIEEYGMTELLADEAAAADLAPNPRLAAALLSVRGRLDANLEAGVRVVISKVIDDVVQRIRPRFTQAFRGRRNRLRRSPQKVAQNFDALGTLKMNLRNYDRESGRLVVDRLRFDARVRRTVPWDVVLCVDQSGSMASSVLYSAVCAGILSGLPGVRVRLVLFDTAVVDVSHLAADPVTVLMTAQLGGGTDIAGALGYCASLVTTPSRTVVTLISDFEEGGSVSALLGTVRRLRASGVTLLGLAALDEQAEPVYDPHVGARLANAGMEIAALTPEHFADWLAEVMR